MFIARLSDRDGYYQGRFRTVNLSVEDLNGPTFAARKMGVEIFGEKLECAFYGRAGHSDEVTETLTFIKSKDLAELLENRRAPLALLNFLQQRREGVGFHSAGGALATRFDGEEFGDF